MQRPGQFGRTELVTQCFLTPLPGGRVHHFGDLEPFLDNVDAAPATNDKLCKILATKKDEFWVV